MDISIYIVEFLHILLQTTKLSTKANITTTTTTTTAVLIVYFQCMCVCCLREPINAFKNQITNQLKNDRLKWNRKQITLTNNTRQHPNPNWKKNKKKKKLKLHSNCDRNQYGSIFDYRKEVQFKRLSHHMQSEPDFIIIFTFLSSSFRISFHWRLRSISISYEDS